jgi:hypothetical protein
VAKKKEQPERVKRLTLADPRTGTERLMGLVSRAASPDKKQNRRYHDSPTTMAANRRKSAERAAKGRKKK